MARFTQNVDAGNPPSGLSYGGGIANSRLEGDQSGFYEGLAKEAEGRATGRVLEGVGNAVATLATSLDNAVQQDLFNAAERDINAVRDMFGVSDATLLAQEGAPPQDLARATNNIKRIQSAYESGALKASDYYARLNAVTKQLKTRYRGYERYVDNAVSSITGVNPANALVSSLRSEAEAAASEAQAGAREWRNYESQNEKYILGTWTNYYELPEDQRPSQDEVRQAVGRQKAAELKVDNYNQFLDIKAKEGNLTDEMLSKGANQTATEFMQQSLTAGINGIAPVYPKIVEILDKAQKEGTVPTPEEAEQIRAQLAQARIVTEATLNQKLSEGAYATMDPAERKAIVSQQMELFDTMQTALNDGDIGVLKSMARRNEAMYQNDLADMLTNDVLRKYYSFTKAFPPELSQLWLSTPELGGVSAISGAILDYFTMRATVGDGDINTDLKNMSGTDSFTPDITKKAVDGQLKNLELALSSASPAAGAALNIVKYLYKDPLNFMGMFESDSSADVFSQLFNVETVAKVKAATESNPEVWTDFVKKGTQAFTSQSRELLSRVGNYNEKTRSLITITINPKTGLLEAKPNEANLKIDPNDPYFVTRSELNEQSVKHMLSDAKKINQYLSGLKAIYDQQENSMEEYNQFLQGIFDLYGIKLDTPTEGKEGEKPKETGLNLLDLPNTETVALTGDFTIDDFIQPIGSGRLDPSVEQSVSKKSRVPVSIRNNNMGAISLGKSSSYVESMPGYIGKTPRPKNEGGYYAKFATPEHGILAASMNLENYGRKGYNTLEKITKRWAAQPGNYIKSIQKYLPVEADAKLDLSDPEIRLAILKGMSAQESGVGKPIYTDETFKAGVYGEIEAPSEDEYQLAMETE